jgi:hypothetical protein
LCEVAMYHDVLEALIWLGIALSFIALLLLLMSG